MFKMYSPIDYFSIRNSYQNTSSTQDYVPPISYANAGPSYVNSSPDKPSSEGCKC